MDIQCRTHSNFVVNDWTPHCEDEVVVLAQRALVGRVLSNQQQVGEAESPDNLAPTDELQLLVSKSKKIFDELALIARVLRLYLKMLFGIFT